MPRPGEADLPLWDNIVTTSLTRLFDAVVVRVGIRLRVFHPEAVRVTLALNEPGNTTDLFEARDADGRVVYRLGDEGELYSLAPLAAQRGGAHLMGDVELLGALLRSVSGDSLKLVFGVTASETVDNGWDLRLPRQIEEG
ncbi:hypothetical protein [Streptomyces sp. cg35]|uniref:hypothetical protein n=1 Tax=Streptomyces sp. cg35 TaxID=3421650 RepID=UPI003D174B43